MKRIELGVPFSDPIADGPVIQRATERALAHRVSLRQVLAMVRSFRETDSGTPVVLMGYLNPIEVMGYGNFAAQARDAGVDGALVVDVPPAPATIACGLVAAALLATGHGWAVLVAWALPIRLSMFFAALFAFSGVIHLFVWIFFEVFFVIYIFLIINDKSRKGVILVIFG